MIRCRFLYEKRGRLCFVPHVEMPPLLCRIFRRAGAKISRTESFVPKDRISLGPPLPMGVAGLGEPAEIWLDETSPPEIGKLAAVTHEGLRFALLRAVPDGPGLSKICPDGRYRVYPRDAGVCARAWNLSREGWKPARTLLRMEVGDSFVDVIIGDANQVGPGAVVASMKAEGLITGWQDLFVVRTAVGRWNGNRIVPALEAGEMS